MRRTICMAAVLGAVTGAAFADEFVHGYVRRDGTYVPPHYRSTPNSTKIDNYSTKGNVNPYTGERGSVDPFAPKPSAAQTYDIKPFQPVQPAPSFGEPPSRARKFLGD